MHVTLIRPARIHARSAPHNIIATPPIGLAYIAGSVLGSGHTVTFLDAFAINPFRVTSLSPLDLVAVGEGIEGIIERIPPNTDCIGISVMFSQEWFYARRVIEAIHSAYPRIPIVVGGEHVTADYENLLRRVPAVTACVLGEGEESFLELLKALERGDPLTTVTGIALRDREGRIVTTLRRPRIRAIDALPWPAWDLVPIEVYLDLRYGYEEWNRRSMPMLATRGCPYQCTFCSNPGMWGTRWIARDPEKVIEEIKYYKAKYAIEHVEFYDLTAIVDRRWILKFTELLSRENLGITWRLPSGTRSEALDGEVLSRMKETGCEALVYAPESGSKTTLERIKKKVKPERMVRSIRQAVRLGFHTRVHFIMGLPGQRFSEILETFWFIVRLAFIGVHDISCFFFYPYPGSALYNELVAKGRIRPDAEDYELFLARACFTDFRHVVSYSEYFSARTIRFFCLFGMALFYLLQFLLRPHRLVLLSLRLFKEKPYTWLERFLSSFLRERLKRTWFRSFKPSPSLSLVGWKGSESAPNEAPAVRWAQYH